MVRDGLQLTREVYDFFPLNRALSLQQEEDSNEVKLETLMHQVTFLVSKMKADVSSTSCVCVIIVILRSDAGSVYMCYASG